MTTQRTPPASEPGSEPSVEALIGRYQEVRRFTEQLSSPLATEDYVIQSMPDCSPTKWHLAHTTWFFETFVLAAAKPDYAPHHPRYAYLFNSYYEAAGPRHPRPQRGLLSRPTVEEVYQYRSHVDRGMVDLLMHAGPGQIEQLAPVLTLGLHHEQQHQELLLTDVKHLFSLNPLRPGYVSRAPATPSGAAPLRWRSYPGGVSWIGHDAEGFAFDNEGPRHRQFVEPFQLASRLVTNGEYVEFLEDGGYKQPELWLSDGWYAVQDQDWHAPLYWEQRDGAWWTFTLSGMRPVDPEEPICHVSYFEADAYARWRGARLPSEAEWEVAVEQVPIAGNFVEGGFFHPVPSGPAAGKQEPIQMFGDVWEWTQSSYSPYPGFWPVPGALGEYNGKFMCNQYVLRGGSCATSLSHVRPTYRNFFAPTARWQFSGIRLAKGA